MMVNNHSKKYLAAGILVSNLIFVFVGAFVYPWFLQIQELNHGIALVLIFTITMVTFCSGIASYFWSFTKIPLKNLRMLALANHSWVLFLFLFHPNLGMANSTMGYFLMYNFFSQATLIIIITCSLLGCWFGRRVFYE